MNLTVTIESAELQFKQILEEFFKSFYDENSLYSHGIDHHRRVWNYSKKLLTIYAGKRPPGISQLPAKLIIASYLHDIGMSVETGIRHGKHSRELCILFLSKHNLPENEYKDVLDAIENHDNKDYTGNTCVDDLLAILSVADDLDAFGFIGIFRYSEIYLTRGIDPAKIGHLILENAGKRFDNFVSTFGFADELVQKQKKRFYFLDSFFSEYNKLIPYYQFGGPHPSGYCGVIEILNSLIKEKAVLRDMFFVRDKYSYDPVVHWFFNGLAAELS